MAVRSPGPSALDRLEASTPEQSPPVLDRSEPETSPLETHIYKVEKKNTRISGSALVFFASCLDKPQRVVIKILRNYEDTRYNLTNAQKRQASQVEAFQLNQAFTPGIYLRLGRIVQPALPVLENNFKETSPSYITIDHITNDASQLSENTDAQAEYALIMECLPKQRRLDYLLRQKNRRAIDDILQALIQRIAIMHASALSPDPGPHGKQEGYWGSYTQLERKLSHNIGLFENLAQLDDRSFYETYAWLAKDLQEIIADPKWHGYFNQRLQQKHVKRCHGDLKARNIWIEPAQEHDTDHRVRILDAIDFNPSYCNIDVLSDIAMLAVDVQAVDTQLHEHDTLKDRGPELAQSIIETYLSLTEQEKDDPTTQIVLTYYLVEKAFVRASVSLFYDRNEYPQLGKYFLSIAARYMQQLKSLLQTKSSLARG